MGQRSTDWVMMRPREDKCLHPTGAPAESGDAEGSNVILVKLSSNQIDWAIVPSFWNLLVRQKVWE